MIRMRYDDGEIPIPPFRLSRRIPATTASRLSDLCESCRSPQREGVAACAGHHDNSVWSRVSESPASASHRLLGQIAGEAAVVGHCVKTTAPAPPSWCSPARGTPDKVSNTCRPRPGWGAIGDDRNKCRCGGGSFWRAMQPLCLRPSRPFRAPPRVPQPLRSNANPCLWH